MPSNASSRQPLPTPAEFFQAPLYERIPLIGPTDEDLDELRSEVLALLNFRGTYDSYCVECQQPSIFRAWRPPSGSGAGLPPSKAFDPLPTVGDAPSTYTVRLLCSRNAAHRIDFYFRIGSNGISKIGQYPSVADLAAGDLTRYRKVLGRRYADFARAVGLSAHGVGVGSFIYLRRIFEDLIKEAEHAALTSGDVDSEAFPRATRMDEKILLLRSYLPALLVENRSLYGILSKGVHDLEEEECRAYFPAVRRGIEAILEEKIHQQEADKRAKQAKTEIDALRNLLAGQ